MPYVGHRWPCAQNGQLRASAGQLRDIIASAHHGHPVLRKCLYVLLLVLVCCSMHVGVQWLLQWLSYGPRDASERRAAAAGRGLESVLSIVDKGGRVR